jgi:riboflavin kinase/FMN adenylyltransferase
MTLIPFSWTEPLPAACRGGAVALGNFDGVHRGHQAILAEAVRQAQGAAGPAVAVTFDPHPLQLLRPAEFQPLLTTVPQRAELLRRYGADHVVVLPTSPALLQLRPEEFFENIIRARLEARVLVEGFNFCFGRNREGTTETLKRLCEAAAMGLSLVPPQTLDGQPISSSRVRGELVAGQVRRAATLLGRPYQITGTVVTGRRRGQSLGFPTANLDDLGTLIPGNGVYAVRVVHRGDVYAGACNIGPNPTFGEDARKLEVHLIDFQGDLYAQTLTVDFVERLRDTRPFASPSELIAQLQTDVSQTREILTPT